MLATLPFLVAQRSHVTKPRLLKCLAALSYRINPSIALLKLFTVNQIKQDVHKTITAMI
jgi:hypothetical protein